MKSRDFQNLPISGVIDSNKVNGFYNTIHLEGNELVKAKKQAESQETKILDLLKTHSSKSFTKHEIKIALVSLGKINVKTPESSISRGLSNLYKQGKVLKLEEMRLGEFDKPNHLWKLASEQLPIGTQMELF
jgi:hypothetical protein